MNRRIALSLVVALSLCGCTRFHTQGAAPQPRDERVFVRNYAGIDIDLYTFDGRAIGTVNAHSQMELAPGADGKFALALRAQSKLRSGGVAPVGCSPVKRTAAGDFIDLWRSIREPVTTLS